MYIDTEKRGPYLVIANTVSNKLTIMFTGSRSQCNKFVKDRAASYQPTHFCHVVKNSDRAIRSLKKRLCCD